jgi:hypothetical protein
MRDNWGSVSLTFFACPCPLTEMSSVVKQLLNWFVITLHNWLVLNPVGLSILIGRSWEDAIYEYEGVSKSFRTGCLERELQMLQLSATRCSCIAILWVSLVSFATITLCVATERVFIIVVGYFSTTQSGNFWIHPRMCFRRMCCIVCREYLDLRGRK